jgi:5S rRNA maturation endonuclease (ribonuclease M5)
VRNPRLYARLNRCYGAVKIAKEGTADEEYRVCCPFCNDKGWRLYINCNYGIYDPKTQSENTHLCHCYNENCVQPNHNDQLTYYDRTQNRETLYATTLVGMPSRITLEPPSVAEIAINEPAEYPGRVIRLDKLHKIKPQHRAIQYMQNRNFNPTMLGEQYGFLYCDKVENPKFSMAKGRIVMPVWKGDMLFSWLCRSIEDNPQDAKKKYYNMPGRPLSQCGYNLETALRYSTVVIVEGILDAIRTGEYATCLFSKTVSPALRQRIVRGLAKYKDKATVVIMLDPDQPTNEKNFVHHIESVATEFSKYIPNVVRVYLPDGNDPADMKTDDLTAAIYKAAEKQKVKINLEPQQDYVDRKQYATDMGKIGTARSRLVSCVGVCTTPKKPENP